MSKQIYRNILKTLLIALGGIVLLLTILSVYVETNKEKILAGLKSQLAEKINGQISYGKADISIWKSFPLIGLHLYDVQVSDSLGFRLMQAKEIALKSNLLNYLRRTTRLNSISLNDGFIHLFTNEQGYTNKYLLEQQSQKGKEKNIGLGNVMLENFRVVIENRQKNKRFDILFRDLDADISGSEDITTIDVSQTAFIKGLGFNLTKGSFLKNQSIETDVTLRYNKKTAELSFGKTKVKVDDHPYTLKGFFRLSQPGYFLLDINTVAVPFEKIKHIFAENTYDDLENLQVEKPIDITARLNGSLAYKTIPRLTANWAMKNNKIITPVATFTNCDLAGSFTNEAVKGLPFTDENSRVSVTNFKGNWEGIDLNGKRLVINNLIHPVVDLQMQSSTDLSALNDKLGLRSIRFLGGKAAIVFSYSGPLQKDISIIDKLNGNLRLSSGTVLYVPRNFTFRNVTGDIRFSPDLLQTDNLSFNLANNYFRVSIAGSNLSGLSATDGSLAAIQCNVYTPSLDFTTIKTLFEKRRSTAAQGKAGKFIGAAAKIDDALDHGTLRLLINAGELRYNHFYGKNITGQVAFENSDLTISDLSLLHAGGRLVINAKSNAGQSNNQASAKIRLQHVDVSKVFQAFDNFGQDGISYENLRGQLDANTDINLLINNKGELVPGSINGTVDFSLKNGALINFEPMENIRGFVFKNKDMSNVGFAELKNKLEVSNYKIKIPRMEIQSTAIAMFVEGLYDIRKKDSKFDIQVPLKGLKKRDENYIPQNIGLNAKAGTSIYLEGKNDKNGKVKIGLNTTKTIRKLF